jgi:hypothetical protein
VLCLFCGIGQTPALEESGTGSILKIMEFSGNDRFSDRKLEKASGLVPGEPVSSGNVIEAVGRIKKTYRRNGYYFVEADVSQDWDVTGGLELRFDIREGPRVRIRNIEFSGNSRISTWRLKRVIRSWERGLFSRGGIFSEEKIREDRKAIDAYYSRKNVFGRVSEVLKNFYGDNRYVDITFLIEENPDAFLESVGMETVESDAAASYEVPLAGEVDDEPEADDGGPKQTDAESGAPRSETKVKDVPDDLRSENGTHRPGDGAGKSEPGEVDETPTESTETVEAEQTGEPPIAVEPEEKDKIFDRPSSLEVEQLRAEVKRLGRLLQEKDEVENLLSGMLTEQKLERRTLEDKLEENRLARKRIEERLRRQEEANARLEGELERTRQKVETLQSGRGQAMTKLQNVSDVINVKLQDIEKLRDELSEVIHETRSAISKELDRIELEEISVGAQPEPETERAAPIEDGGDAIPEAGRSPRKTGVGGKVLVVNKDLDFIVINAGASKGVYKGMKFEINREGKKIGRCRVIEVRKNISAADVIAKNEPIRVGSRIMELIG